MFIARPAAEIEPQLLILSSKRILPGPIRPSGSRSIRTLSEGNDGDGDLRMVRLIIQAGETYLAGIIATREPG
jgi:hypothetical protein